jgi:hypothetical protein
MLKIVGFTTPYSEILTIPCRRLQLTKFMNVKNLTQSPTYVRDGVVKSHDLSDS